MKPGCHHRKFLEHQRAKDEMRFQEIAAFVHGLIGNKARPVMGFHQRDFMRVNPDAPEPDLRTLMDRHIKPIAEPKPAVCQHHNKDIYCQKCGVFIEFGAPCTDRTPHKHSGRLCRWCYEATLTPFTGQAIARLQEPDLNPVPTARQNEGIVPGENMYVVWTPHYEIRYFQMEIEWAHQANVREGREPLEVIVNPSRWQGLRSYWYARAGKTISLEPPTPDEALGLWIDGKLVDVKQNATLKDEQFAIRLKPQIKEPPTP